MRRTITFLICVCIVNPVLILSVEYGPEHRESDSPPIESVTNITAKDTRTPVHYYWNSTRLPFKGKFSYTLEMAVDSNYNPHVLYMKDVHGKEMIQKESA